MAYLTFSILGINPSTESALKLICIQLLILGTALFLYSMLLWNCLTCLKEILLSLSSSSAPLPCGVLQSSILGPILFALYLLLLGTIIRKYGVSFHVYADDSQIYLKPLKTNDSNCAQHLFDCLQDIKAWMVLTFLNFSENKTEVTMLGPSGGS